MSIDYLTTHVKQSFMKRMIQRALMVLIAATASMVISVTSYAACGMELGFR